VRVKWVVQEAQALRVPQDGEVDPETAVLVVYQDIQDQGVKQVPRV